MTNCDREEPETDKGKMGIYSARTALRATLTAGIVYDLVFALVILIKPSLISSLFKIPQPQELIYLKLNAVFLVVLCMFYLLAVLKLEKYSGIVTVAIIARFLGAVYFAVWVFLFNAPEVFLTVAVGDGIFGILHFIFFRKSELPRL